MWGPFDLITSLSYTFWTNSLNFSLSGYGTSLAAVVMNSHALIAINRIWAMTFPLSYRTYYTRKVAVLLCIYRNGICSNNDYTVSDHWRSPQRVAPLEKHCSSVTDSSRLIKVARFVMNSVVYEGPLFILVTSYPYICFKYRKKQQVVVTNKLLSKKVQRERSPGKPFHWLFGVSLWTTRRTPEVVLVRLSKLNLMSNNLLCTDF